MFDVLHNLTKVPTKHIKTFVIDYCVLIVIILTYILGVLVKHFHFVKYIFISLVFQST